MATQDKWYGSNRVKRWLTRDGDVINPAQRKIKDYHDRNTELFCICQPCDKTFESVSSALLEVAAITYATMKHTTAEEIPTLLEFRQARLQIVNVKLSPNCQISRFFIYVWMLQIFVRQASLDGALQEYVTVTLRARILYLSHHLSLAGHQRERCIYDNTKHHFFWLHMENSLDKTVKDSRTCA